MPLVQLATYCRFGETRYGFILTQEELVAFRVRRINGGLLPGFVGNKPCAAMEYKSIPWNESGPGKLTINLAIWTLGCMGMNDYHRVMESPNGQPLDSMVRLTKWTHDKTNKVYRNIISGREIPEATWKNMSKQTVFVDLDNKDGLSFTSSFTQTNFAAQGGGVAAITQGLGAVSLNAPQDNKSKGNNGTQPNPAAADAQQARSRGVTSQQTRPRIIASSNQPTTASPRSSTTANLKRANHPVSDSARQSEHSPSANQPRTSAQTRPLADASPRRLISTAAASTQRRDLGTPKKGTR